MHAGTIDEAVRRALSATARPEALPVAVAEPGAAAQLAAEGRQVRTEALSDLGEASVEAIVLLDDELGRAGEHAERLVDDAARALRPDGALVAVARNRVFAAATGLPLGGRRAFSAAELDRVLGHRGFAVDLLCAPGAAGRLRAGVAGDAPADDAALDVERDRQPGLLDAAPHLLVVARAPRDADAREERFFATLPRKVVAASVLCRADDGRLLVVYDAFKRNWTIPGGVVDADESPRDGAEREAYEETGLRVAAGPVLGLFAARWPDRLVIVYDAVPVGGGAPTPQPVHDHEVSDARWVDFEEALDILGPGPAFQVRRCVSAPGGTWGPPASS